MQRSKRPYGLGVYRNNDQIYLYHNNPQKGTPEFVAEVGTDGFNFHPWDQKPILIDAKKRIQSIATISDMRLSHVADTFFLTYKLISDTRPDIRIALSKDLINFDKLGPVTGIKEIGQIVPEFLLGGKYVMYFGEHDLRVAYSPDLKEWQVSPTPALVMRRDCFDNSPLMIAHTAVESEGIVVYYYVLGEHDGAPCYSIGRAVFDKNNPQKLINRSPAAILEHVEGMSGKQVLPVGIIIKGDELISYWDVEGEGIVAIAHPARVVSGKGESKMFRLVLKKIANNPILRPIAEHFWENRAVFNPAAIYDSGKIHLIYRALGDEDVSRLGYASSTDGTTIDERSDSPIYGPRKAFEMGGTGVGSYTGSNFSSGGGIYGGIEDPRLSKIDDTMYMMYVAYDGGNPPRVAMTKISVDDFRVKNWNWSDPVLISRPGVVDKNASVLSEKIRDQYVIFHRIYPDILIDYVPSMDMFDGETFLAGQFRIGPRPGMWDSNKVGIGAPPIKTDKGWLLIYQAVGHQEGNKYKIGAMLLDPEHPEKVLYRSHYPILEPDRWYENEGHKFGVVYPCGAVIHDGLLRVYYGGADTVVCEAHAPINDFLDELTHDEHVHLYATTIKSVK